LSPSPPPDDAILALVRRHDPDRFLTALFAPAERRDALLTLYAFNHELARAREVVSEPALALIRLHWWREVVEGERRRHEVAGPLGEILDAGLLRPDDLLALIDARELEAEPAIETLADWRAWLLAGAGGLAVAAARLLGAAEPERFRGHGAAYGVAGVLRSHKVLAAAGRSLWPVEVLAAKGLSPEQAMAAPDDPRVHAAGRRLVQEGHAFLAASGGGRLSGRAVAAALPSVLARRDFARWPRTILPRGTADRLAVTWAGVRGRV
jgi:phytoene synthase